MEKKTAREVGWKYSEYNLYARVPNRKKVAWLNTFSGSCSEFSLEEYVQITQLLDLPENDRLISRCAKQGLITQADEKELLRKKLKESCLNDRGSSPCICLGCFAEKSTC